MLCRLLPQSQIHNAKQLSLHPPNLARLTFPKGETRKYVVISTLKYDCGKNPMLTFSWPYESAK